MHGIRADHVDHAVISHLKRYRYYRKRTPFRLYKDFCNVDAFAELGRVEISGDNTLVSGQAYGRGQMSERSLLSVVVSDNGSSLQIDMNISLVFAYC